MTSLLAPDGRPLAVTPVDAEVHAGGVRLTVDLDDASWLRVRTEQLFHLDSEHAPTLQPMDPGGTHRLVLRLSTRDRDLMPPDLDREALLAPDLPDVLAGTESWYAEQVQHELDLPAALRTPGARIAEGAPTAWAMADDASAPLLSTVRRWLAEQGMQATRVDDATVLRLDGDGANGSWVLWVETREAEDLVLVWSSWPKAVPEDRRRAVMELVTRLNTDIAVGAYELDLDRGQLSFRTSLDVAGQPLGAGVLARLVGSNVEAFDDHLPAVLAVLDGHDPQVALAR